MMSLSSEWHNLQLALTAKILCSSDHPNPFYNRLVQVLASSQTGTADVISAYRDALLAAPKDVDRALYWRSGLDGNVAIFEKAGLIFDPILRRVKMDVNRTKGSLWQDPIYGLEKRRDLKKYPIDPALSARLKDNSYTAYNGAAQEMAVRIALTSPDSSTLFVNLPTGCGKTLVAHALCGFSAESNLTLVIVPTIGLAIEQGNRASECLEKMGGSHGKEYHWHGQQSPEIHSSIKLRIRDGEQRILFCSPESACKSLLPVLFDAASAGCLANIVVDEAHLVDQWGVGFRPYFQIFSAVVRSLRSVSDRGIKCCLMSATFTEKSLDSLKELFSTVGKDPIEIHGAFIRPEIQYNVRCVTESEHRDEILSAVWSLPKPLIIYTTYPENAEQIYQDLESSGFLRKGLFTGRTTASNREEVLDAWSHDRIDIMVATSAFGVGMDKDNVRSVLHADIPENLDRFYQEVGRSGRDGIASQSLLLYHCGQFNDAEKLNSQKLISVEIGLDRWQTMWREGTPQQNGDRVLPITAVRRDLNRLSGSNEEWNWRTILLMQRTGLIKILLPPPELPTWDPLQTTTSYQSQVSEYYEKYYSEIRVTPLVDGHLKFDTWERLIGQRRLEEKRRNDKGFECLRDWIKDPSGICLSEQLREFYTIRDRQPEFACGGCPQCSQECRLIGHSPTVGCLSYVKGYEFPVSWKPPLGNARIHQSIYYSADSKQKKHRSLLRHWGGWISMLVTKGVVTAIRSDPSVLTQIEKSSIIDKNIFWIGLPLEEKVEGDSLWPELILVMPDRDSVPDLGSGQTVKVLVAPEKIKDQYQYNCLWWEKDRNSKSLINFLRSLNHVNCQ